MFIIIPLILIGLLAIYGLHIKKLFSNGLTLFATAEQFPRDYYVGNPESSPLLYVAMGDSTVQGSGVQKVEDTGPYLFATALASKGNYVHVINLGVAGERVHGMREKQLPQLANLSPDYITVTIGANDVTHFTNLADFSRDITAVINELTDTKAQVFFATSIDVGQAPALPPLYAHATTRRAAKQTAMVRDIVSQNDSKIIIVDLFADGKLTDANKYASDRFHPNEAGYAVWAKLFSAKGV